jgi:MmyB-like transcription regulator ligand binding domain
VAEALIRRVQREAVGGVIDAKTAQLIEEVLGYPGVPRRFGKPDREAPLSPVIPVSFRVHGEAFDYFSTITTLGTPQDITVQELRVECFHPANRDTEARARALRMRT